jgi:predicted MFS family arabinose efflux permease
MSGLSLLGCFVFLVLQAPRKETSKNVSPDRIQNAETEIKASVADKQFTIAVRETFYLLISRKMSRVIPAMIWGSLSLATFAGSFVTLMTDTMSSDLTDDEQLQLSLFAMIPLGVGQMIGGALMGQVIDRRGMKIGIIFSLCQVTLAFGIMLWYVYTY